MIQFQISTRNSGRLRTVKVSVYETLEELREAGVRHSKRIGSNETGFDAAYGLAQSVDMVHVYESGRVKRLPFAGHIRLWAGALRTGIITHECTHMAVAIYKQDVAKTIPDMDREERLCYLVGDLSARLVNRLYHYKLI